MSRKLVYLLLPGIFLHELTHAVLARPYGDVAIDWAEAMVWIEFDRAPPHAALLALLGPTVIGVPLIIATMLLLLYFPPNLSDPVVLFWLAINMVLYAAPSPQDVDSALSVVRDTV